MTFAPEIDETRDTPAVLDDAHRGRLRIVHCFRSPVGGIFRHVRDLVAAQVADGHAVGILCDASTGGAFEENLFRQLLPSLELGLHRIPMKRSVGPADIATIWRTRATLKNMRPEVLHAHGAKGGAYARLIGALLRRSNPALTRLYCPHGGSIHYDPKTLSGRAYFAFERLLERYTERLIFVSEYERDGYLEKVGLPACPSDVVYNGLALSEFEAIEPSNPRFDFLCIGMMRDLKGTDLFIDAIADMNATGRSVRGLLVGDGPDAQRYKDRVRKDGLDGSIEFRDPMPVRNALALADCVVVPSRAESMPYVVLETIAAQRPLIATNVGGIPEVFGTLADRLVCPDNAAALRRAMETGVEQARRDVVYLHADVAERFSSATMAAGVMRSYRSALAAHEMEQAPLAPTTL